MNRYDIVVIGGGLTGCASAIAGARLGQKVLLVESAGYLGGAAANCLVYPFMRFYTTFSSKDGKKERHDLSRGIFSELLAGLRADENVMHFNDETLKILLDEKVTEAGVDILFHATLCGVDKEDNHLKTVSVMTKSGVLTVEGNVFIDCTGDADLCATSGVSTRLGRPADALCQPMTLCFRVGNVDKKVFFEHRDEMQALYKTWQAEGKIKNVREDILVFDYPMAGVLHFNTTRIVRKNPVNPFDVTDAEIEGRRQVREMMDFFRDAKIAGMENAVLLQTAPSIGVRESRMLDGDFVLTGDELIQCAKFEDAIAAGNYDIDIHNPEGSGTSHHFFEPGTWYTIPYRTLIPKKSEADNLLVAGRCISVDHEAQASIRIMPICCTTGEAAGVAAAVANETHTAVQDADVRTIQTRLTQSGAYIGL